MALRGAADGQTTQNLRLYGGQIPELVQREISALTQDNLIEVNEESMHEFKLDVQSVLRSYVRMDRRLTEEARDLARSEGLDHREYHKIKRRLAEERRFKLNRDAPGFIADQLIETFMQSTHVEEIFASDQELRVVLVKQLREQMGNARDVEGEVRRRLNTIHQSSQEWEARYAELYEKLSIKYNLHGDA